MHFTHTIASSWHAHQNHIWHCARTLAPSTTKQFAFKPLLLAFATAPALINKTYITQKLLLQIFQTALAKTVMLNYQNAWSSFWLY